MIDEGVTFIADHLDQYLKDSYQRADNAVVISNLLEPDGSVAPHTDGKVVVSLANIEKEVLRSASGSNISGSSGRVVVASKSLQFNVYLLFSACFSGSNYLEALKYLSSTISCFQVNPVFDHQSAPDLPLKINRLALDIENLDLQQLSHLWGIVSGRYLPSVMYKVRMITIDAKAVDGEIDTIKVTSAELSSRGLSSL